MPELCEGMLTCRQGHLGKRRQRESRKELREHQLAFSILGRDGIQQRYHRIELAFDDYICPVAERSTAEHGRHLLSLVIPHLPIGHQDAFRTQKLARGVSVSACYRALRSCTSTHHFDTIPSSRSFHKVSKVGGLNVVSVSGIVEPHATPRAEQSQGEGIDRRSLDYSALAVSRGSS